jgi:hypothetical protein
MATARSPDVFVIVHYFGYMAEVDRARAFCDAVGAWLFEDAAHVIYPHDGIGDRGDFTCYSPRKFFEIRDGGILAVRGAELSDLVTRAARRQPQICAPSLPWAVKLGLRKFKRRILRIKKKRHPLPPTTIDAGYADHSPFLQAGMSRYSRWVLSREIQSNRHARIAATLVAKHRQLSSLLSSLPETTMVAHRAKDLACWIIMRCTSESAAAFYLSTFRAAGFECFTWPNLPTEVIGDVARHGRALAMRRTTLFFTGAWRGVGDTYRLPEVLSLSAP